MTLMVVGALVAWASMLDRLGSLDECPRCLYARRNIWRTCDAFDLLQRRRAPMAYREVCGEEPMTGGARK